ncbi:MAG: hypothetical protein MUE40_21770, partial [Anaerolineae bacterium]|nr:hypothetical protein [Anaerolineae bacterium]
ESFLTLNDWRLQSNATPYKPVLFPRSSAAQPFAANLAVGYISASTLHPEACYRLLQTIATTPDIYSAMPLRRSVLDAPALTALFNDDVLALYREIATQMDAPDFLSLPYQAISGGFGSFINNMWLNVAMDAYVLRDADLETELATAQQFIDEFNTCTAGMNMEMIGLSQAEMEALSQQIIDCAISIDPAMEQRLGPMTGN